MFRSANFVVYARRSLSVIVVIVSALVAAPQAKAARPCMAEDVKAARAFIQGMLRAEANGDRLRELLGLSTRDSFYHRVSGGGAQEPGWDVVEIPGDYHITKINCVRSMRPMVVVSATVQFEPGWWMSRDNYKEESARTAIYRVGRTGRNWQLLPQLPGPFLSPRIAATFIGREPYVASALAPLRARLLLEVSQQE